uniref:mannosyl-oligosaccharide 1,3-1,6-alpha-mannosidase n=1 Tax=Ditylenchus dipsaci TaxID=166011 RepID=A0A915DAF6_9BILA
MSKIDNLIAFDDYTIQERGWKQGFSINYTMSQLEKEPRLEVIIMPFSHNDPGWLKTFEEYFEESTDAVITSSRKLLPLLKDLTFVWSEITFLDLWWTTHNESDRLAFKRSVRNGQMEILTGSWVMADEAGSHYFSTIMQLSEGHDPTMAYLLKECHIEHMVIQRVHYAVKKYLAKHRQLEFYWRQFWAGEDSKYDTFTHMLPFDSYDYTKSCGPDPEVCCQFEFRKLGKNCNEGGTPIVEIVSDNVKQKSNLLADQYRKKAQLYKSNVVLVPHGMDFMWSTEEEWKNEHKNLAELIKYINENEQEYHIHARFGTLKDYFAIVEKRIKDNHTALPTLSGDFLPYADKLDEYWSGYFTSRPFHKHLDRSVQNYLRSADILFSMANQKCSARVRERLTRRWLSLFQHHDAIAGTSRKKVMDDYANKMVTAIKSSQQVIEKSASYLLNMGSAKDNVLDVNEEYFFDKLPRQKIVKINSSFLLFNSLTFEREEVMCIWWTLLIVKYTTNHLGKMFHGQPATNQSILHHRH